MRNIKTTTGAPIPLDGDLLAILETLYREITVRRNFDRSFEDMIQEIRHLIDQMTEDERKAYLAESLFLNSVKYENDRADAYMRNLASGNSYRLVMTPPPDSPARGHGARSSCCATAASCAGAPIRTGIACWEMRAS